MFSRKSCIKAHSAALFTGQTHLLASQHARQAHSLGSYAMPEWQGRAKQTLRSSTKSTARLGAQDRHGKSHNTVTEPASRITHMLAIRTHRQSTLGQRLIYFVPALRSQQGAQTRLMQPAGPKGPRPPAAAGRLCVHKWPFCRCNCMDTPTRLRSPRHMVKASRPCPAGNMPSAGAPCLMPPRDVWAHTVPRAESGWPTARQTGQVPYGSACQAGDQARSARWWSASTAQPRALRV